MSPKKRTTKPRLRRSVLARPYRVLNIDAAAHRDPKLPRDFATPNTPVAMVNEAQRWCLTEREAIELAAYCKDHGYRVEIALAQEVRP